MGVCACEARPTSNERTPPTKAIPAPPHESGGTTIPLSLAFLYVLTSFLAVADRRMLRATCGDSYQHWIGPNGLRRRIVAGSVLERASTSAMERLGSYVTAPRHRSGALEVPEVEAMIAQRSNTQRCPQIHDGISFETAVLMFGRRGRHQREALRDSAPLTVARTSRYREGLRRY